MSISPRLAELRSRLEVAGMIVVEEPDHINVRLPFFCSARVYSDAERLRFESYFGLFSRVKSTSMKLGGFTVLAIASGHYGLGYAGIVALLAVVGGIYDSIRWQVTEHAITRVTTIAALAALEVPSARRMAGYGTSQTLRSGDDATLTTGERVFVREKRDD
jgi:hypothetical protein